VTNMARGRGLPKPGNSRLAKWQAKYDPTTVGNRFAQVQQVAIYRAEEGIVSVANIQSLIGGVLDQYGIAGPMRAAYIAFGEKVWHATQRITGAALANEVNGLTSYFQTAYGCNPSILQAIAQALGVSGLTY